MICARAAIRALCLAAPLAAAGGCAHAPADAPAAAPPDPACLAATWYVIAASRPFVARGEAGVALALRIKPDGTLVEERRAHADSFDRDPDVRERRWQPEPELPGRWRRGWLWPFTGARRLVYVAPDCTAALFGGAGRGELEVLAREREIPEWTYAGLVARLAAHGYEVTRLRRVPQRPEDFGRSAFR